ncbi:hypothetical protein PHMEG_00036791 [Phytophthora megakarya]|uniref:Uncharacterized protein n=1 Tax=Phytophthora megakarya TaxID=4795 RepID=A0A225UKS4_9STRA|nr:hypothetical protein PHMEG_00036791 [Phytophthora megakarya]
MELRWNFTVPWCAFLKGRIKYFILECAEKYIDTIKKHLQVTLRSRYEVEDTDENTPENKFQVSNEEDFQSQLVKIREAPAVLAAVAHFDDQAWKYLLQRFCDVKFGQLGGTGEEVMHKKLLLNFILFMDMEQEHGKEQGTSDLQICGREHASLEYLNTLDKIAALDANLILQKGVDIQIPVKVHTSSCLNVSKTDLMRTLAAIQNEEKLIKGEWEMYTRNKEKEDVKAGKIRCTSVLEPMIIDLSGCAIAAETANVMNKLVHENVWASEVSVRMTVNASLDAGKRDTKETFCRLMTSFRQYSSPL